MRATLKMNCKLPLTLPSILTLSALLSTILLPLTAQADDLSYFGDFRARYENDWNSAKSDGTERDDRQRFRIRVRGGANYQLNSLWNLGIRVRSGSDDSQQSPHITIKDLDHNDKGDRHFNIDKAFIQAKNDKLWFWAGRNSNPMFKNNEIVWDDDVTLLGAAVGIKTKTDTSNLEFKGGYFTLPVGMDNYAGNLAMLQAVIKTKVDDIGLTAAATYLAINADKDDSDTNILLNNNGLRDYQNWIINLQAKKIFSGKPLTFAMDYIINTEDYASNSVDPYTALHHDENDGWVVSLRWGSLKKAGQWQLRYDYAHIETFAVNNSYAQDDWVRWGNATQTRASNFKGSEMRLSYAFSKKINLVSRLYIVDAIDYRSVNALSKEDANRFRMDLNWKF